MRHADLDDASCCHADTHQHNDLDRTHDINKLVDTNDAIELHTIHDHSHSDHSVHNASNPSDNLVPSDHSHNDRGPSSSPGHKYKFWRRGRHCHSDIYQHFCPNYPSNHLDPNNFFISHHIILCHKS